MDANPPPGVTEALANLSVVWVLAIVLVFLLLRPFVVQAYFIPSPSMEPTLIGKQGSGDRILVNKFDYRLRHGPRRGDVVVFLAPPAATEGSDTPANADFIKRLMGVPGDRLKVIGGRITVNGSIFKHFRVRQLLALAGEMGEEEKQEVQADGLYDIQADYHVKFVPEGVRVADNSGHSHLVPKQRLSVIFTGLPNSPVVVRPGVVVRNGRALDEPFIAEDPDYDMQVSGGEPLRRDYAADGSDATYRGGVGGAETVIAQAEYQRAAAQPTQPIPPGKFLMMGDNRNDSSDGTVWGLLDGNRIVGKADLVFWPLPRIGLIH